jgi:hypothetical protein
MFQVEITESTNLDELYICDKCDEFFPRTGFVSSFDSVVHLRFDYPIVAKEVWKDHLSRFLIRYFHKECLEA